MYDVGDTIAVPRSKLVLAVVGLVFSLGTMTPTFAATKLPRLTCTKQTDKEAQVLCKYMEQHMRFSMGYHGVAPGFTVPISEVVPLFCRAGITTASVPVLTTTALLQYSVNRTTQERIVGQTSVYLLALLGKDVLKMLPVETGAATIEEQYALRALHREVEEAITGSVFSPGATEHVRMHDCRQGKRKDPVR